jgi:hypothetical protein
VSESKVSGTGLRPDVWKGFLNRRIEGISSLLFSHR